MHKVRSIKIVVETNHKMFNCLCRTIIEFVLTPAPAYIYRTIGGLLDIYIFMGPTPEEAAAQYHQAVGPQPIPAYWSLGFNLCRWSYNSVANMRATIDRLAAAGIPQVRDWTKRPLSLCYRTRISLTLTIKAGTGRVFPDLKLSG